MKLFLRLVLTMFSMFWLCLGSPVGAWAAGPKAVETAAPPTTPGRPVNWAQPVDLPATENFYRVSKNIYRAAQPTATAMKNYEAFGIKTVLNLRGFNSDANEVKGTNLTLIEIPLNTWNAGDDGDMIKILQTIRDAKKPILIHCRHGADRTGLVVAMYRMIEQKWTREQALDELKNGGYGYHSIWVNIPQYVEDVDLKKIRSHLK